MRMWPPPFHHGQDMSPYIGESVTKKTNMASRPWVVGRIHNGETEEVTFPTGKKAAMYFRSLLLYDLDSADSDLTPKEHDELFKLAIWVTTPAAAGTDEAKFLIERTLECGRHLTYYFRMAHDVEDEHRPDPDGSAEDQ